MDCKAVQRIIYRFVYGESDEAELRLVKSHLDRCKECEQERKLIGEILDKIKHQASCDHAEAIPDGCRDRILGRIYSQLNGAQQAADSSLQAPR